MPMATIHKMGDGDVYHIHFLDSRVDPGYGRPGYGGGHPDQGLPGSPGHPANRPPGSWDGTRPDHGLPGGGHAGIPDNSLPETKPPQIAAGYLLILARGQDGKWHYAALAPGSAPPKPLPEPPKPDTGPVDPNAPPAPDQTLPPIAGPT